MNGFELYKKYIIIGDTAGRGTQQWEYAKILTEAFYAVGITQLFDLLEKAEELGMRLDIDYSPSVESDQATQCDILLVNKESEISHSKRRSSIWAIPKAYSE